MKDPPARQWSNWPTRGIRFDRVQATSSWTLPSHASMFTGRWPHELSAGWLTPLDRTYPTLAEFLGSRGYATAGFVANYSYCASGSGLERGFTAYEDYMFPRLTAFKAASLVDRSVEGIRGARAFPRGSAGHRPLENAGATPLLAGQRRSQGSGGWSVASFSIG